MRPRRILELACCAYALTMVALANLPAHEHLPALPMSISTSSCPSGPVALRSEAPIVPLVLGYQGGETPASSESCKRVAALVRSEAPAYEFVPERFICAEVREHAHERWLESNLWPGPHLWVLDGRAIGAGSPGFAAELRAAGLRYQRVNGNVEIAALAR